MHTSMYRFTNVVLLDRQNQMHLYILFNCPVENITVPVRSVEKLWAFLLGVQKSRGSTWDKNPNQCNVSYID